MADVRLNEILGDTLEWDSGGEVVQVTHAKKLQGVGVSATSPTAGQVLTATSTTDSHWADPTGDVTGPASSVVGSLAVWNDATGSLLDDSGVAVTSVIQEGDSRLDDSRDPNAHAVSHENGGGDEISVQGLSGLLADPQTPTTHATSHKHGGSDEISTSTPTNNAIPKAGSTGKLDTGWLDTGTGATQLVLGNDYRLSDDRDPTAHALSHQDGGSDPIDVTGLTGLLADPQIPTTHKATHENGGGDEISVAGLSGLLADPQTPATHATAHQNGGSDEISVAGLSGVLADPQIASGLQNLTTVVTTTGASAPTAGQVLKAVDSTHATWQSLAAGGDASGPASSVGGNVASFADTTGKLLQDSGIASSQIVLTSDPALTNSRDPNSHASSHMNGGSDEISTSTPAADAIPKALGTGKLDSGWIPTGSSAGTICAGDDGRLNAASKIATSGTAVTISSTPPTAGQILRATSPTDASWVSDLPIVITTSPVIRSPLQTSTTASLTTSARAYWVWLGQLTEPLPSTCYVNFWQSTAGAGAQTAEVCLATTPAAPNAASQTVTVRVANGTLTSLTVANQMKRNTSAMDGSSIAVGSHLWIGFRPAMATTQPTVGPWLINDFGFGRVLTTNSAAAFAANGTYTGAVTAAALNGVPCPDIFLSFV